MARRARGGRVGDYGHGVLIGAVPGGVLFNLPCLPAKPSTAGSPGRGGARERAQFSPSGGNGDKRTQGELARRAKRRWPGPLRRRAAMGKGTRRPQAAKFPAENHRSGAPGRRALQKRPPQRAATWGRPYKKKINPKSRWRSNPPAFSQKRVSTFLGARDFKMLGGSKFRLRQGFACGKTLVRRVRAAPSAMGPRPKRRKTRVLCWNRFRSYSQIAVAK